MRNLVFILLLAVISLTCKAVNPPISVIFDTDMGNDVDDALALDMLYKYHESGKIKLLGILLNKDNPYIPEFIDIMATWYGHTDIPVGLIKTGVVHNENTNYAQKVCEMQQEGVPLFRRSMKNYDSLPEAHLLYRQILAAQPDHSVTVISVGFSTNIARLLDTPADVYSPLTGKELAAKKVRLLSVMGGSFGEKARKEFNIIHDMEAARKAFAEWPSSIVVSPFELGSKVRFPAQVIENDLHWEIPHPVAEAYKVYLPMPYNRQTWDLTSVLYVAEPDSAFMTLSEPGVISVTDDGYTLFNASQTGKHSYLSINKEQAGRIKDYFIRLITQRPRKYTLK